MARLNRRQRRALRGFTLTELMVSLVMGVIVALAAVGLSKTATTTFYEQARSTTAEGTLRAASTRLRQDLMRASFMSTGNIALDPKVARLQSATTPAAIARYPALTRLRGLRIDVDMRADGGIPATLTTNGISPDALELTGNFAADDQYSGTIQDGGTSSGYGSCSNPQTITLDSAGDASTYTLGGGSGGAVDPVVLLANAKAAFMPKGNTLFLAQVTDAIGCNHYVPVCDVAVTGASPSPVLKIMVQSPGTGRAVLYSNSSSADQGSVARNCGASEGGRVTIAPLQRVRWFLDVSTSVNLAADPGVETPDKKVDLMRSILDFNGGTVFTEVIGEYMVDLKFGIVLDDPTGTGANRQKVIDIPFDTADPNNNLIDKDTADDLTLTAGNPGPQRVRAVRFRMSARAAVPDRREDLNPDAGQIRARYCVDSNIATCKAGWARVRTLTSEVVLTNQAGMFY